MMIIGREGADINDGTIISKKEAGGRGNTAAASAAVASSSSWSRLKDPRIVRVSRAFGGKDRHSKVCTVRGLRDRRVRLSVPTAIQLYDLQDRLGLNQPSKVVDWLLNAAKHEIDELPPLQMPPNSSSSGNFLTHHQYNFQPLMLGSNNSHHQQELQRPMKIGNNSTNWDGDDEDNDNSILRTKAKEEEEEEEDSSAAATRESNVEEEDNNNNNTISNNSNHAAFINVSPSNNFFSSRNSSTPPTNGGLGLLNNISSSAHHQSQQQQPYSSLMRWDPSTLSLAQSQPQSHPVVTDDFHSNFNVVSLGSGHHHQVLVYQPAAAGGITAAHSYFPSQINAEYAPKQINFQMLMSSTNANSVDNSNSLTQAANEGRPFHLTSNFLPTTQKDCGK